MLKAIRGASQGRAIVSMRKYLIIPVIAAFVLSGTGAFAQEGAKPSPTPKVKVSAEVREAQQAEKRKEQMLKMWNKMEHRLTILIRNQTKLADRIAKRLSELKNDGKDVAALEVKLANARTLIGQSQAAINAGDAKVELAIKNSDQKAALGEIRAINKDILEKIKASHKALVEVIKAKGSLKEDDED
jgi:hypothetical protein